MCTARTSCCLAQPKGRSTYADTYARSCSRCRTKHACGKQHTVHAMWQNACMWPGARIHTNSKDKLPFWLWNALFISYFLPSCHRQLSSRQPARKPNKVDIGNYLRLTLKCVQWKRRISMNSNVLYYVKNKRVWLSNVCWCVGFLCMDIFGYELCYSCQIVFVFQ